MITFSKGPNFLSQSLTVVTSSKQVPLNSDRDQLVAVVPRYTEYKRNFIGENPLQGSSSNRLFPSCLKPLFQSEAKSEAIDMKIIFNYVANKTHFHNKGFALSLVLKVKLFGTRKWPIFVYFSGVHPKKTNAEHIKLFPDFRCSLYSCS